MLEIEPGRRLCYTWAALGFDGTVTFPPSPTEHGTPLNMEQAEFPADRVANIKGAMAGWRGFLDRLTGLLAGLDGGGVTDRDD